MIFTRDNTFAMVLTWPDNCLTWELSVWLHTVLPSYQLFTGRAPGGVVCARNKMVEEFVLKAPSHIQQFIFADKDMRPSEATMPMLSVDADLVGVEYPTGNPNAWGSPETVHLGLFRVNRRVFEVVPAPWFMFEYSASGTSRDCECAYFAKKVLAAGFTVGRGGTAEHEVGPRSHE